MILYWPKFPDGRPAPLNWALRLYRILNCVSWPLDENVSNRVIFIERVLLSFGFLILIIHNCAGILYFYLNQAEVEKIVLGIPVYFILCEGIIRSYYMAFHKTQTRNMFKKFFANIYVDNKTFSHMNRKIQRQMIPIKLMSVMYVFALINNILDPFLSGERKAPYNMEYPFDITALHIFIPITLSHAWGGTLVTTTFGELNILAEFLVHLNARYLLLKEEIDKSVKNILETCEKSQMALKAGRVLKRALIKNVKYNSFANDIESASTFRMFIFFSFSTGTLCCLIFITYTAPPHSTAFTFWFFAKIVELMSIGELGSILYETTNKVQNIYYDSNWEEILLQSTNKRESLRLMKIVAIAIELNQYPFTLTGMKYFAISLNTVVKILQGAFSYFTFLMSLR